MYFTEHIFQPHTKYKKYVMGFLPYWRLDQIQSINPDKLSEINYFSLSVLPNGHIATVTNGETDPGWNGWIQQSTKDFLTKSQIMGAKVTVTISVQDNQLIQAILSSATVQQNLISDIVNQIKERKLNGINIDFEYSGEPDDSLQQEFTYFSKNLSTALKAQNQNVALSLSIMPLSARDMDLYNLAQLLPIYDHFIGMSYDYYGQTADIAGPVAPMYGFKQGTYFFDVTTTYSDYLKFIPKNKIIMGIPTYGWEWAVGNGPTMNSETFPSDSSSSYAAVISYARAREDGDLKPNQCQWDKISEETWCWFTDKQSGVDHQAWIVDNKMLQIRFDYANHQNFAGVGFWTLGLDQNYPDIWNMVDTTFAK
jgi:spore germination protein